MNWTMMLLLVLAASRATHLIADDLFPLGWLRDRLDRQRGIAAYIGYGLGCTFCISIWAGLFGAWIAVEADWVPDVGVLGFLIVWFAIAQAIVLVECTVGKLLDHD